MNSNKRFSRHSALVSFLTCVVVQLVHAQPAFSEETSRDVVTTIAQFRKQSESLSEGTLGADITATVTFVSTNSSFIHVQQEANPLVVFVPNRQTQLIDLKTGDRVRVRGKGVPRKRHIIAESVEFLPEPADELEPVEAGLMTGEKRAPLHAYCYFRGTVRQAVVRNGRTNLVVYRKGERVDVEIHERLAVRDVLQWVKCKVRVEGTLRAPEQHAPMLMVSSANQIEVQSEPSDELEQLRRIELARVLYSDRQSMILIEHPNFETPVSLSCADSSQLSFGDLVSVQASLIGRDHKFESELPKFRCRMMEVHGKKASVKITRTDNIGDTALANFSRSGLTQVSGTVVGTRKDDVLIAAEDGQFVARLGAFDIPESKLLQKGDLVRLAGVPLWKTQRDDDVDKQSQLYLFVPSADHIQVDQSAVAITRSRLIIAVGVFALLLTGAFLWNSSLRRQVAIRTRRADAISSRLATSFEAVQESILLSDEQDLVAGANSKFGQCFGFQPKYGSSVAEILEKLAVSFDDSPAFRQFCCEARDTEQHQEIELSMAGRTICAYTNAVRDKNNQCIGRLWAFNDRTEQRRLELELVQAQKMDAIGMLSGGIAHDFNNLLTVISSSLAALNVEASKSGAEVKSYTEPIGSAVTRAASLTKQMLDFARSSQLELEVVDANELTQSVFHLARHSIDASVAVNFFRYPTPLYIRVDTNRIEQVLLNLCINARDALEETDGVIRLRTRLDEASGSVCIEVEDDGIGMTVDVRERIFDPFYTTKSRGAGTGLGLSMAIGIVKQHNGNITVESTPGVGSTLRVHLPLAAGSAAKSDSDTNSQPLERTPESRPLNILVVDDEALVRKCNAKLLQSLGHQVITADDGVEALETIERTPMLDIVLLDMTMPRMSGDEAYKIIRSRWPALAVIICTGYTSSPIHSLEAGRSPVRTLTKPFRIDDLSAVINQMTAHSR